MIYRAVLCAASSLLLLFAFGCTKVEPDAIGVRTMNFGSGEGIVQKDYGPGYHRYLWPLDTWHRFPSTVQRVRFARDTRRVGGGPIQGDALQVISSDGDRVALSIEVFFRIADNAAHRVLQDSGSGDACRMVVLNFSQDAARKIFGNLRTEDFYDEPRREAARRQAITVLREGLQQRGIELVDLLVDSIDFDPNYENLIKEKKIADQRVELEKARARAAEERGQVERIKVETQAKLLKLEKETDAQVAALDMENKAQIASVRADAGKYATERTADAELYASQKRAEGARLIGQAEAEGTQRMNRALDGDGSRNLVAAEAVRSMNLGEITFPSVGYEWFNPFDMAARLGADGEGAVAEEEPSMAQKP